MVAYHLLDYEAEEFLAEFRIKVGIFRECAQPLDLALLARGIGWRQSHLRLVLSHGLSDPKSLRKDMDQRRVDIVDAFAEPRQDGIGLVIVHGIGHIMQN